jgi:hypothetical protein
MEVIKISEVSEVSDFTPVVKLVLPSFEGFAYRQVSVSPVTLVLLKVPQICINFNDLKIELYLGYLVWNMKIDQN